MALTHIQPRIHTYTHTQDGQLDDMGTVMLWVNKNESTDFHLSLPYKITYKIPNEKVPVSVIR